MVNQSRPSVSPESRTVRMWGCCSRAETGGEVEVQQLERDRPVVAEVLREPDRSHPPAAELALEGIAVP